MRARVASQVAAFYILPNLLLASGAVPAASRFWVFGVGMMVLMLELVVARWSPRQLGFRADTPVPYVLFTTSLTAELLVLAWFLGRIPGRHPVDVRNTSLISVMA